jgi:hypothetical protein
MQAFPHGLKLLAQRAEHAWLSHAWFPLQSPSLQHPPEGMHWPSQTVKPEMHLLVEHWLFTQANFPPQSLSPQQGLPFAGMHLRFPQSIVPAAHLNVHWWERPSHIPVSLAGAWHSLSMQQEFVAGMQVPLQSRPGEHRYVQARFAPQVATFPGCIGQSMSWQQSIGPMQAPLHGFMLPAHIYVHLPELESHLPTWPAGPIEQSASLQQFPAGMH